MPTAWNTKADIVDVLSAEGVLWATDDERDGIGDDTQVTNAIARARLWVMQFVNRIYDADTIAGSEWGRWTGAIVSAAELMRRRAEGVPVGLQVRLDQIEKFLEQVAEGTKDIPDVLKRQNVGSFAVQTVTHDMRPKITKIRRVEQLSTQPPNQILPVPGMINPVIPDFW